MTRKSSLLFWAWLLAAPAAAQPVDTDYMSVSTTSVWVREEPQDRAATAWKMWKYNPVVTLSFREDWIRVRDYEGDEGWLPRAVLSETPTVCVFLKEAKVRAKPSTKSKVEWILDKGYPLRVFSTKGDWYEVSDLEDVSGWINKAAVWGFPANAIHRTP